MTGHGPMWPEPGNALDALIDDLAAQHEARELRRFWAAVALACDVNVCGSILAGRPVLVRQLDPVALRRALRGEPKPQPGAYLEVTAEHLDAVAEGGAFG